MKRITVFTIICMLGIIIFSINFAHSESQVALSGKEGIRVDIIQNIQNSNGTELIDICSKQDPGVFIGVNDDCEEGRPEPDHADDQINTADDDDWIQMSLVFNGGVSGTDRVILKKETTGSGDIKIYDVTNGGENQILLDFSDQENLPSWDVNDMPRLLYAEGLAMSTEQSDVKLKATWAQDGAGMFTDVLSVTVVKVELTSISGENEWGHAKVSGRVTPTVTWSSTRKLVNGVEKSIFVGGITAGNFVTWIDQNWLLSGENNTITFEITVNGTVCADSFTAHRASDAKIARESLGGVLLCEGMGLTRWINRDYTAYYDKMTYSIPASGKIRYVNTADVFLDWSHFPPDETPIVPHENWYNNIVSGDHFLQNMGTPEPPVIIPPRTKVRQARTFKWTEAEELKAKAKCQSYILEGCPATPVLNGEVEVDIND